jgi:tetratricopeptide (TPR) repeat protein
MEESDVFNPPSREGEVAALREAVAQLSLALQSLLAKKVSATSTFPAGGAMDVHAAELAPELLLLVLKTDGRAPGPPDSPSGANETRSFETPKSVLPAPADLIDKKSEDAQSAPPLPDFELRKLYITGLQAKANGDLDRAETFWQHILDRNTSYLNGLVAREMQRLQAQLRPIHVRKYLDAADRARAEGAWEQELASLEALLRLEPQNTVWARRRKYALQNRDNSELYEIARELVAEGAKVEARDHLKLLWNDAPAFGDPVRLGAQIGYTYEDFQRVVEKRAQDAKKELEEAQLQLAAAEAERMSSLIAWEKKTRRQRFRHDILGDGYLTIAFSYACFSACLVIALSVLANQVSFPSDMVGLPFHLSRLIFVAVLVVPASLALYFVVISPTLPIAAFLAVIVASLGLGELLLQTNWSLANPAVHVFTLPFLGRTTTAVDATLWLLLFSALAAAIVALIAGLLIGIGLYVVKITHNMTASIGLSLLYSVVVAVSYVIVANIIRATLGYTVAGLIIGTLIGLVVVVIRVKDADTTFLLIILPAGIALSLFIRFVESPLFGLSDLSANWLAISLIFALLFGYGAGKIFRSSVLAVRYLQNLRHRKREGFDALRLFIEAHGTLPSKLSLAQLELLKDALEPLEKVGPEA